MYLLHSDPKMTHPQVLTVTSPWLSGTYGIFNIFPSGFRKRMDFSLDKLPNLLCEVQDSKDFYWTSTLPSRSKWWRSLVWPSPTSSADHWNNSQEQIINNQTVLCWTTWWFVAAANTGFTQRKERTVPQIHFLVERSRSAALICLFSAFSHNISMTHCSRK